MLVLALLLVGMLTGSALHRAGVRGLATHPARMRLALAGALVFTGADHLATPERYLPMLPEVVPAPAAVIVLTGLAELAGAAGLFAPRVRRLTGCLLAAYLVAVLPANAKVLLDGGSVAGLPSSPAYYAVRLLLQPLFVWWALAAAEVVRLPARRSRTRRGGPSSTGELATLHTLAPVLALAAASGGLTPAAGGAQTAVPPGHTLTVVIEGARSARGLLRVALFAAPAGFPRDQATAARREELLVRGERDSVVFAGLPAGRYAAAVHHDENGSRALDTNAFGIPKEGWAASNDPRPRLRAPRFEEAAFELAGDRRLVVRLTY